MPETIYTVTALWGSGDDTGQRIWRDCDVHEVKRAFAHFTPQQRHTTKNRKSVRIAGFRIIVEEQ